MKKRLPALLLALVLAFSLLPGAVFAATAVPTQEEAYQAMIAMKSRYPNGMKWNNDDYYGWKGGIFSGGYGCAGFAFLLSDAAFGDLPARRVTGIALSDVRVGDILRINNDTHSVIVLEVHDSSVTIAEGNYSNSIYWGRTLTKAQVEAADYMLTRYPVVQEEPERPAQPTSGKCGDNLTWTLRSGVLTIEGTGAMYNFGTGGGLDMPWFNCISLDGEELHTVVVGSGVTSIGNYAFYMAGYTGKLTSVTIPASVTSIGASAFSGCTSLKTVNYGGSKSQWDKISVGTDNAPLLNAAVHCAVADSEPETPKFNDVFETDWYANSVTWAVKNGITTGTNAEGTTFDPTRDCVDYEILTFLYRANSSESTGNNDDMAKAANWARANGLIGEDYDVTTPCTRATAVWYIWKALGADESAPAYNFTDVDADAKYAAAVNWAVAKGITNGSEDGTTFSPNDPCDRSMIVTFLYRAYANSVSE